MAYNKYTWKSGDVISSARLNNIEDGIEEAMSSGGGVMIVNVTPNEDSSTPYVDGKQSRMGASVDKTYDEIKAALDDCQIVVAKMSGGQYELYFRVNMIDEHSIVFDVMFDTNYTVLFINGNNSCSVYITPQNPYLSTTYDGTQYSNTHWTYDEAYQFIDTIKLHVANGDKGMLYIVSEVYSKDKVIAFNGAGKVGPLYMDKDGNISETYPTSGGADLH